MPNVPFANIANATAVVTDHLGGRYSGPARFFAVVQNGIADGGVVVVSGNGVDEISHSHYVPWRLVDRIEITDDSDGADARPIVSPDGGAFSESLRTAVGEPDTTDDASAGTSTFREDLDEFAGFLDQLAAHMRKG